MQSSLKNLLHTALDHIIHEQNTILDTYVIQIDRCREARHGDFSSNIAMILAKPLNIAPRELAMKLIAALPSSPLLAKVDVAGPGFINFTLAETAYYEVLAEAVQTATQYGRSKHYQGQRIHLEYVSANPTGPLHVGHGRSAAYASCVANLLSAVGYQVHREYYVNDAGRQMRILALSTWLRYLERQGEPIIFPENAYQGDYIIEIAEYIKQDTGTRYHHSAEKLNAQLAKMISNPENKETSIDEYIIVAQRLLGKDAFEYIQQVTLSRILADIREDLAEFGVEFDQWFHESQLIRSGLIEKGIALLQEHGYIYSEGGATWFRATALGDEKDRVLIRENGQPTYFASDVAYHLYKYDQKYDAIVDVFGADHHGYMARIRAFLQGLGKDPKRLTILLVQFVSLFRGENKVSMSTRSGSFVTLRALREEVGNEATRFFYIFRKPEQHLDFDLELAKRQSNDNPVYYIQYAHARMASVWQQLIQSEWQWQPEHVNHTDLAQLSSEHEKALLRLIARYPETVQQAAIQYAPHVLAHYLHEAAHLFHSYYNHERFLVTDHSLRNARLYLIKGVQTVIANGLTLLGIRALDRM